MARRQLENAAIDAFGIGHVAERHVVLKGLRINLARDVGMHQQALQFRCEHEVTAPGEAVVQRLDAQMVARKEDALRAHVPDREREHAAQPRKTAIAPVLPGAQQHFGVAVAGEREARRFQLRLEQLEVIQLAVVHEREAGGCVDHWLLAVAQVDDRQAPMTQAYALRDMQARLIGTAMTQCVAHRDDEVLVGRVALRRRHDAGDSAHAQRSAGPASPTGLRAGCACIWRPASRLSYNEE